MTYPKACIDENLTVDNSGLLRLKPWAVPRLVADVISGGGGGGLMAQTDTLPGVLMSALETGWINDMPMEAMLLIRITRGPRHFVTSNPNAVQVRDRWSWAIGTTEPPANPVTSGIFNSQCGGAIDVGTNTVAEPNPGKAWFWLGATSADEWVGPIPSHETFRLRYACYAWTPPPFSDNANKNSPEHVAQVGFARCQLIAFPAQGSLVTG